MTNNFEVIPEDGLLRTLTRTINTRALPRLVRRFRKNETVNEMIIMSKNLKIEMVFPANCKSTRDSYCRDYLEFMEAKRMQFSRDTNGGRELEFRKK